MKMPTIEHRPGWTGAYTSEQAEGAIPNGTLVAKRASEPGDGTPDGTHGTVLGSIDGMAFDPEMCRRLDARFMYWVEWSISPRVAVAVVDRKVVAV